MNPSATLLFERDGSIAKLTLNRPDVGNAIDLSLAQGLMKAAINCDEDDSIGCVVLTGAGRFFCTGGDVCVFRGSWTRVSREGGQVFRAKLDSRSAATQGFSVFTLTAGFRSN